MTRDTAHLNKGKCDARISKQRRREVFRKVSAIVKLLLLLILVIGIPIYLVCFDHAFLDEFSSIRDFYVFFQAHKSTSILIYLLLQVLQIVISVIPGQALQFAAGYFFHFWLGLGLSLLGATLGTAAAYYIARFLGHDAMLMIFGEEKINAMVKRLDSKRGVTIVFLLFLIPGIPKDLCSYAAGLSEIKLKPFLILSLIGRTPGMIGSLLIGRQVQIGGYTSAAIIAGIAAVLFLLGLIFRRPIMEWSDRAYEKLRKMM